MKTMNVKEAGEGLNAALQEASRGVRHLRYSAEDALEETRHRIRTRPLTSVVIAASAGLLVGTIFGWFIGKRSAN